MRPLALLLACLLGAALIAGCSDEESAGAATEPGPQQATGTSTSADGNAPVVSVSADKTHAVQPGDEITVTISVSGFELDESRIGQANAPGVGHYRIYLDEAKGDDHLATGAAGTVNITVPENITDGSHDLRVVLYNNDETPLDPPAEGRVLLIVYRL